MYIAGRPSPRFGFGTFPSPVIPPCPLSCSTHHRSPHNRGPAFCRCVYLQRRLLGFLLRKAASRRQTPLAAITPPLSLLGAVQWLASPGGQLPPAWSPGSRPHPAHLEETGDRRLVCAWAGQPRNIGRPRADLGVLSRALQLRRLFSISTVRPGCRC